MQIYDVFQVRPSMRRCTFIFYYCPQYPADPYPAGLSMVRPVTSMSGLG